MPFRGVSVMEQREGFVMRALEEGTNIRGLCRAYGISPTTGYRWLGRYRATGSAGLDERSRRPHHSPKAMPTAVEEEVVALRREHPCWGGRKIHHVLRRRGLSPLPHANTITDILHRRGLIAEEASAQRRPYQRFERDAPNELWQMDFKGHFAMAAGRCHPLTVLDDHSRYDVTLVACANERRNSVQPALSRTFECYGMPQEILIDNGPPWGKDFEHRHTKLTAWLMRLGNKPTHGRPYHPQTRGKNERFNGTLAREGIGDRHFRNLAEAQRRFDTWRHIYNYERPHQGIGDEPPASRFRSSTRRFPAKLPPIAYGADCLVRRVQDDGRISWGNRNIFVSSAFAGEPIGLRPTGRDGVFDILYCSFVVSRLDLTATQEIQK